MEGTLLAMVLPLTLFSYMLLENPRPSTLSWQLLMIYICLE